MTSLSCPTFLLPFDLISSSNFFSLFIFLSLFFLCPFCKLLLFHFSPLLTTFNSFLHFFLPFSFYPPALILYHVFYSSSSSNTFLVLLLLLFSSAYPHAAYFPFDLSTAPPPANPFHSLCFSFFPFLTLTLFLFLPFLHVTVFHILPSVPVSGAVPSSCARALAAT